TLAQLIYNLNGDTEKGLHLDITERDPEHIQEDILKIIEEFGEFMPKSEMMTGYGFAVLRDGVRYNSVGIDTSVNNLRDFWIYFGRGTGHGHADCLNLGIEAYGLNIAPDLGYPEQTGTQPNRVQWVSSTLSHNTVMVDGKKQLRMPIHGTPLHFDDSDSVKVMDIDAHGVYAETDIYRRTVVMVKVNDDVSYGVDFFRILGGDDHIYSFHSQSEIIHETEGLELIPQVDKNGVHIGTYASPDVPWGSDPETIPTSSETNYLRYPPGTTWLDYVRRDKAPDKKFAVDFKITDFKKILNGNPDLHLRMTMLNDYSLDEVAICHGTPPRTPNSISTLEYVLARRTGENLDTLFTTVFEPYKDSRYIKSMTSPDLEILSGVQGPNDTAQAVKIEHVNGRIDYIIYSTNNSVKYKVDNSFEFQGFVGVFSIKDGIHIIEYINDGTTLSDVSGKNAYTGTVIDFTRELTLDNNIKVNFNEEIDPEVLIEKYIYIENNRSPENGVYRILSAKKISNEEYEFDVGDVTLIRSYYDANDIS
ncbi:MAG: hypothetical protein GX800_07010, partial [Clostridiaceae bacterium]|nr:hypothetical protein [Clostridiaceae bacterium]